jgi:predicted esterase
MSHAAGWVFWFAWGFSAAAFAQEEKKEEAKQEKQDEPEKKALDAEAVWKALDDGAADALKGLDTAALVEVIRKGRPVKEAAAGEVKERLKDAFGGETDLWIIVPPKYDKAKPAGVFLVLHGLGGSGEQLKELWRTYAAANNAIVAAPSAQKEPEGARNEDSFSAPIGGKELLHWWSYREGSFPLAALAALKRRFAIDENRVVLTGYSMGGFGTWNIGLRYPDRFAALIPYAGGLSRTEYLGLRVDERLRKIHLNSFNLPVYFVHGDADKTVPVEFDRESRNQLQKLGYSFEYKEIPKGGHVLNVREGGEVMTAIQKWIKDKVRKPHPRDVKHHALGDYCARSYWVKVEEFADKAKPAEVRAAVKGQTIELAATGARKVALYVDEAVLDLSKPIKVTSGAATLFEGEVKPDVAVLLESWKAREDRDLLYRARVVVEPK